MSIAKPSDPNLRFVAGVIRDALVGLFRSPKEDPNPDVIASYQISRMIRNAFAHSMLYPRWSIDEDCRDRTFAIDRVFRWRPNACAR